MEIGKDRTVYQERIPYVSSLKRQAIAGASFTAKFPRIDSYDFLLARSISVSNADNGGSRVEIGISYGSVTLYVQTLVLTSDTYFYKMTSTLIVPKGYQVVLKFSAHAAGDIFLANVTGELVSYGESSER